MLRFYLAMALRDSLRYRRYWSYFLTDAVITTLTRPRRKRDKLLLCRLDQLGDLVLTMHLRKPLEQAFGFASKDCILVHNSALTAFVPLLFPGWQSLAIAPRKLKSNLLYRLKTLFKIRRLGAKIAIIPTPLSVITHALPMIASAAEACHFIGCKFRHHHFPHPRPRVYTTHNIPYKTLRALYLDANGAPCEHPKAHDVDDYSDETLQAFDFHEDEYNNVLHETALQFLMLSLITGKTILPILDSIESKALPECDINITDNAVLLQSGAFKMPRVWPLPYWFELAKTLAECGFLPIFLAGPNEPSLPKQLDELTAKNNVSFPYRIEQSPEPKCLASLIAHATALISNDTGMAHLAIALHKPTIVIRRGGLDHLPPQERPDITPRGSFFPYPHQLADEILRVLDRPDAEFRNPQRATHDSIAHIIQALHELTRHDHDMMKNRHDEKNKLTPKNHTAPVKTN